MDITAPKAMKAAYGIAYAIVSKRKFGLSFKALNEDLKSSGSYGTVATKDGGFVGFSFITS